MVTKCPFDSGINYKFINNFRVILDLGLITSFYAFSFSRDHWNRMDCLVLVIFSVIFLLRALATLLSQQVKDNNLVLAAGHLYGINTLVLSFRVFGHVLEQLKKVGIIQITLINILFDICVLLGHFALAILAFSFSITKAYVAEKSFSQGERNKTGK